MANRLRIGRTSAAALLLLAAALGRTVRGDEPPRHVEAYDENPLRLTIHMRVSPAAEAAPALRYRFLVPPVDQAHGNAATFYYKAQVIGGNDLVSGSDSELDWLNTSAERLPLEKVKTRLERATDSEFQSALADGARADYCDWGDPIRQLGVSTPLDASQRLRNLARTLALLARVQIAEHRWTEAIETLRLNYALSRHLGQSPTIVQSLIGMAIAGLSDETTRDLIAQPDSPNLYWALTELASHPVESRGGMSYETHFWQFTVHRLVDLEQRTLSADEALALARQVWEAQITETFGQGKGPWGASHELALTSSVLWIAPEAKAYLLEHDYSAEKVEAMPLVQRAMLYRWRQFGDLRDEYFKWTLLPDDEGKERLTRLKAVEDRTAGGDAGASFLGALPAAFNSLTVGLRKQREINLLRSVEALRMYAAEQGTWPKALADVKTVPVPSDPVTGNPFEYSVAGNVVTLAAPAHVHQTAGSKNWFFAITYELTLSETASGK